MHNPIPVVGIPKELRGTFLHQVRGFSQVLTEVHKRAVALDEHWKQTIRRFVARCEEDFGLASRDVRMALQCGQNPDLGVRIRTNLTIFSLAKLIGEIGTEARATRLIDCMDELTNHGLLNPSGLVCRSDGGNYPSPLDVTGWAIQAQAHGGLWICHTDLINAASATMIQPIKPNSSKPLILTTSQKSALARIRKLFKIRGSDMEWVAGVWSRPFPLVCGISGSGKTTIIRYLAEDEKVLHFIVDSGAWILRGAKNESHTLDEIRETIRSSASGGILLIDELDKFCGTQSSWDRCVVQELMALMDGRLTSSGWTDADLEKLRQWMIVGGATFQLDIRAGSKALGFHDATDYGDVISEVLRRQTTIPEELVARFNARWIALEPPEYSDFCRQIRSILDELKYEPEEGIENHVSRVARDAVNSGQNMRFVEAYLSELIEDKMQSDASFLDPSVDDYLPMSAEGEIEFELI